MSRVASPLSAVAGVLVAVFAAGLPRVARAADADVAALPSVAAAAPAASAASAPAPGVIATTEPPRSFGHVLGDVLTQRVLLAIGGVPVQPVAWPAAGRLDRWLERRPARVDTDRQGRRWLVVEHQVINAPQALMAIELPALRIATTGGGVLVVAPWPVSIGPLAPAEVFGRGDLQAMRPDREVPLRDTAALQRDLQRTLSVLAAVLLAWSLWWGWRQWQDAQRLPFAQAWARIRRLEAGDAEAWLAMHHALNLSAGRVVHGATLAQWLADAPHLAPLQDRLEAFYRRSAERFYADDTAARAAEFPLAALSRALRDAERRHQR
ncbi:calcium incorporation protein MxaA [Ideonella sp. A 288]|uniref:calcium incorporation protein MxaA n=1 Tax=Ideonella sp. A 288 TaxID=1962181 RepID=UPI001F346BE8|nr:calcium incorporation protein MxaA [Ideonella sp. A 288]